jgi:hypothetical protein
MGIEVESMVVDIRKTEDVESMVTARWDAIDVGWLIPLLDAEIFI